VADQGLLHELGDFLRAQVRLSIVVNDEDEPIHELLVRFVGAGASLQLIQKLSSLLNLLQLYSLVLGY